MKNLLVVAPHFPPKASGVGDYVFVMCEEWSKIYSSVTVLTLEKNPTRTNSTNVIVKSFELSDLTWKIWRTLKTYNDSDILIQFTPNMYAKLGLNIKLLVGLFITSLQGIRFSIYFHEKHHPVSAKWPDWWLGPIQKIIYLLLKKMSAKSLYSFAEDQIYQDDQIIVPVCSNLIEAKPLDLEVKKKFGLDQYLMFFGTTHASKCIDWVLEAYIALDEKIKAKYPLVIVGSRREDLPTKYASSNHNFIILNYLPTYEVSHLIAGATLLLAPFIDGLSSRRGSALAAFENGVLVVSNFGRNTNTEIPWSDFCLMADQPDFLKFAQKVKEVLDSKVDYSDIKRNAVMNYQKYFSKKVIAQKIQNALNVPNSP
ncbi:MAG: hypothetical protein OHK0056_16680 [Bacteriovoracaceae bacterium]